MGYTRIRRSKAAGAWAVTMAAAITATVAAVPAHAGGYVVQVVGNLGTGIAINASGQVAGQGSVPVGQGSVVDNFVSGPNGGSPVTDFGASAGTPLGAPALGLNDNGLIATTQFIGNVGTQHAFLIGPDPATRVDLGTLPGGTDSFGSGVNNSGQVVGTTDFASGQHAFYSDPNGGTLHDIGAFAGGNSTGTAINNAGDVVGFSDVAKFQPHAFFYSGGVLHDLGTLGGSTSEAYAVNSSGQVVGTAELANGTSQAFISDANGGALHDLGCAQRWEQQRAGRQLVRAGCRRGEHHLGRREPGGARVRLHERPTARPELADLAQPGDHAHVGLGHQRPRADRRDRLQRQRLRCARLSPDGCFRSGTGVIRPVARGHGRSRPGASEAPPISGRHQSDSAAQTGTV